jgi:hypothetical protein
MKKIFLSLIVAATFVTSCNKDRIDEEPEFESMDAFFNKNKPQEQEFIITSDSGSGPVVGKDGTELWGFRDVLMYPNGDTIPFPYSLKLIELYTYKDMILFQMPSLAGTNILETGGEIKVRACHAGNELVVIPGKFYPVVLSTTPTVANMNVYQGNHPNDEYGDWNLSSDGSSVVDTGRYGLGLAKLGWQNCGKLGTSAGTTDIIFTTDKQGGEFISLFLAGQNYHGMLQGSDLKIENAPIGESVTVVAMAMDQNDNYYIHKQTVTVTAGLTIPLTMNKVSEAALLSELGGL